ncbi:MAG: hypothetical protein GC200_01460 [Tepidisphaera sp.]|nr:hypothetical protein [Tepidisphaera sp.]
MGNHAIVASRVVAFTSVLALAAGAMAQPAFMDLGAGHDSSAASAIDPSGAVIVGYIAQTASDPGSPVKWTADGTWVSLPLTSDYWAGGASGISADGQTVAGTVYDATSYHAARPAIWSAQGLTVLPTITGAPPFLPMGPWAVTYGMSGNGATLYGYGPPASGPTWIDHAFRWTAATGTRDLGTLTQSPSGTYSAYSYGASADGSVIVGKSDVGVPTGPGSVSVVQHGFRWTAQGGMQDLGALPGAMSSGANAISADGAVIVGWSSLSGTALGAHAVKWVGGGAAQDLGLPGEFQGATAYVITPNGQVIAGTGTLAGSSTRHILVWSDAGVTDVNQYLASLGVDLGGLTLNVPGGISADGRVLVGTGMLNGKKHAWLIRLGITPCNADLNDDGVADQGDIDYLINVVAGGENPAGIDPDFNGDGVADQGDVDALVNVVAGGACP